MDHEVVARMTTTEDYATQLCVSACKNVLHHFRNKLKRLVAERRQAALQECWSSAQTLCAARMQAFKDVLLVRASLATLPMHQASVPIPGLGRAFKEWQNVVCETHHW